MPSLKTHWYQILLALAGGIRHGLQIQREVLEATDGEVRLWPGTLYGALDGLEERGLIAETPPPDGPDPGGNPRYFRLTDAGRSALEAETDRLGRLVDRARARLSR